ncbi:MAG TPA: VCBS domain-containing protein [Vicinamibacteria bacterium]|nr:VCBS domain-containing protein [Vicinamibacteria bacterium]
MNRIFLAIVVSLLLIPFTALAETWKDVPVVDTLCLKDVKADPDKHTKQCALQCAKGGYGVLTIDGEYLTFDAAGNEKALAALKAATKSDHLRATVEGTRTGQTIELAWIAIE